MHKSTQFVALYALAALAGFPGAASAQVPRLTSLVVIQQVYAGGGERASTFASDYVVLINRGTTPVSIDGWTLQAASANSASWQSIGLNGSLNGGEHLLIALPGTTGNTSDLPTPDLVGGFDLPTSSGKVALVRNATALMGACPRDASIADFVGYGSSDCAEGYSAPFSIATYAVMRHGGCLDTDSNLSDFFAGLPVPKNRASAGEACPPITIASYSVSASSFSVSASGGSLSVSVTACPSCTWIATAGAGWIAVSGGAVGIGSGVVTLTVAANTTGFVRVGSVVIAGITISISEGAGAVTGVATVPIKLDSGLTGDVFTYSMASGAWAMEFASAGGGFSSVVGNWGSGWSTVQGCDFNGDGLTDFFLYNASSGAWAQAINIGGGVFSFTTGTWSAGWQTYVGDFNGDHHSDVFLYNASSGLWFQCLFQSGGGFSYTSGQWDAHWEVHVTDWNGDGTSDLFLYMMGWWYQVTNLQGFGFQYLGSDWGLLSSTVYEADFNGDGRTDMFVYDSKTGSWFTSFALAGGGFSYVRGTWSAGWTAFSGDFDGNGRSDLFLYNAASGQWVECISDGAGGFAYSSGRWGPGLKVYISDFDGDGRADVLTYGGSVWTQAFNTGIGTFRYTSGSWSSGLSVITHTTR